MEGVKEEGKRGTIEGGVIGWRMTGGGLRPTCWPKGYLHTTHTHTRGTYKSPRLKIAGADIGPNLKTNSALTSKNGDLAVKLECVGLI